MSTLDFKVIDLDFPVGSKNKTATLITGEQGAFLIDTGFTRADGHRLAAEILDSGKNLTKVFISHADPDYYWGAEVIADAFPDAEILATPLVIEHIKAAYEGKLKAWEPVGANRPTRLVEMAELTGDLTFEGHVFQLKGGHPGLPDRHYLWQAEHRAIVAGVLLFQNEHVWVADTGKPQDRAVWIELLDEMTALDPAFAVPGHRLPTAVALDASPIAYTRNYLTAFEDELDKADNGEALTNALVTRYPGSGMLIAAQLGAKVAKGEMTWG
ncbi:MBL fold metallo-hydrolase [Streptomyces sp. NPDC051364]|uniref:MBL fold metallo-hydrolase n=1 Tax=Streptomyces sp. NPDC051364 TaxID=3155799 RepID=UPI003419A332